VQPNRHPHYMMLPLLSYFEYRVSTVGHIRSCPGRPLFALKIAPSCLGICSAAPFYNGSLGQPESTSQMTSQSVQPFCTAHDCERSHYLVISNRLHLARAAIGTKMLTGVNTIGIFYKDSLQYAVIFLWVFCAPIVSHAFTH